MAATTLVETVGATVGEGQKKRIVKTPDSTVTAVLRLVFQHVCRQILLVPVSAKIGLLLFILLSGSILCDLGILPTGFWSSKSNLLNVYFAKFGWGWTFTATLTYIIASHYVINSGRREGVLRRLVRLLAATACWLVVTYSFQIVEHLTGSCTDAKYATKGQCRSGGHSWTAFDPSGHAFLMAHCILTIAEELKDLREWERALQALEKAPVQRQGDSKQVFSAAVISLRPYIVAWLAMLVVTWLLCFVLTTLYFHSLTQKFVGFVAAVASWFAVYKLRAAEVRSTTKKPSLKRSR